MRVDEQKIAKLAVWMNDNRGVAIGLDGHVDDANANDNDPTLSARRVQAVRGALIAAGVAPNRIRVGTFGARAPVCREATDACRELNRRVEVLAAKKCCREDALSGGLLRVEHAEGIPGLRLRHPHGPQNSDCRPRHIPRDRLVCRISGRFDPMGLDQGPITAQGADR